MTPGRSATLQGKPQSQEQHRLDLLYVEWRLEVFFGWMSREVEVEMVDLGEVVQYD